MNVRFRGEGFPRRLLAPRKEPQPRALSPHASTQNATAHNATAQNVNWTSEIRFFVKASRPGFWLTSVWFYLLPLAPHLPLRSFAFWLGLVYVGFPLGMLIYAANDLTDELTDRLNPRKDTFLFGARPTRDQIVELPWRILLVQVPFVALFIALLGPRAALWFAASFLASSTCWHKRGICWFFCFRAGSTACHFRHGTFGPLAPFSPCTRICSDKSWILLPMLPPGAAPQPWLLVPSTPNLLSRSC
jgi:hypothetical protein